MREIGPLPTYAHIHMHNAWDTHTHTYALHGHSRIMLTMAGADASFSHRTNVAYTKGVYLYFGFEHHLRSFGSFPLPT